MLKNYVKGLKENDYVKAITRVEYLAPDRLKICYTITDDYAKENNLEFKNRILLLNLHTKKEMDYADMFMIDLEVL